MIDTHTYKNQPFDKKDNRYDAKKIAIKMIPNIASNHDVERKINKW